MSITIRRLSHALGAEVTGVDITGPIEEATVKELNELLMDHLVLLFRGQPMTRAQHIEFGRLFGETLFNPPEHLRDHTEDSLEISAVVSMVVHEPTTRAMGTGMWHSDLDEFPNPAAVSLLRCIKLPDVGGNTMFANMQRAYDDLSTGMKEVLNDLHGVYVRGRADFDLSTPERYWGARAAYHAAAQPVVRTHPESGRRALYLSARTNSLVGMTEQESKPLIEYLVDRATRPENVYRHEWLEDDLVIWDNRSVLHNAVSDYDPNTFRHMERVTTMGDESGYQYFGPFATWPAAEQPVPV